MYFLFFISESNVSLCGPLSKGSTESSSDDCHKFPFTVLKVREKNPLLSPGVGGHHSTIVILRETLNFWQLQASSLFTILYLNWGEELRMSKTT